MLDILASSLLLDTTSLTKSNDPSFLTISSFHFYGFDGASIIYFEVNLLIDNIAFVLISAQATFLNAAKLSLFNTNRIVLHFPWNSPMVPRTHKDKQNSTQIVPIKKG